MKTKRTSLALSLLSGCLLAFAAHGQTMIESFEYASDADLLAAWSRQGATLSLSPFVAEKATGTNSLKIERSFGATAWDTEIMTPLALPSPMTIAPTQYITFRVAGDPQFTNATYQTLFVYAYDGSGNFGRWGAPVPTDTTNWQVFNFIASGVEKPWDSPAVPDLNNIVQFKLFLYGQGDPSGPAYSATLYVDELMVRDTALVETPSTSGETVVENFEEYASDEALLGAWTRDSGTIALASYVASGSGGTNSLRVDRSFSTLAWDTQVLTGPTRGTPLAIGPSQYVVLRVAGDPQFTNASWQSIYVYAYDGANNFGRWGAPVPTTTNWQVMNFLASTIEQPWNSPALPDLNNIVQFKIFIYGQGGSAGNPFDATFYVDDLMIRDKAVVEFPPPSPVRSLLDNFETYADDTALGTFYSYMNNPGATVTTASLASPAPQGNKALKMTIDFAAGQYPWGSVRSSVVAPFSLPTNAVVQCRFKGDPALAPFVDDGTSFWITFYDEGGHAFSFNGVSAPVASSEWVQVKAAYDDFWSSTAVDTGNLVRWRILVQAWTGTASSQALSGTFYVDALAITVPPVLSIVKQGGALKLQMDSLIPGTTYTLRQTTDFSQWTTTAIQATATSQTWDIPAGQKGFYQLYYTP